MYYRAHVARVNAELARPFVGTFADGTQRGGFTFEKMRIAGLARTIQTRLYIHSCGPNYCLKNRAACRFFYPWPEQPQQQFDMNSNRVALRRRYPRDDRWVVPHDLEMAMFSPATINVLPFNPYYNKDQMVWYVTKYVAKGDKTYYIPYVWELSITTSLGWLGESSGVTRSEQKGPKEDRVELITHHFLISMQV